MAERDPMKHSSKLEWQPMRSVGRGGKQENIPIARSGHTLTIIGSNGFLFGGLTGEEPEGGPPPGPNNEMFWLKIGIREMEWSKVRIRGESPLPRWRHTATATEHGTIALFGGFHSSVLRLNDFWIFNTVTLSWTRPVHQQIPIPEEGAPLTAAQEQWTNAPSPRGGHTSTMIEGKLWVFGGYGGYGYARRDLDDLCVLDFDKMAWSRPVFKGKPPPKRSGHQACAVESSLYVFGGWNSMQQFADLHILDISEESPTWQNIESSLQMPRWNFTACSVMAIPSWKIFLFGGVAGELGERNRQGTYLADTAVLDTGMGIWKYPEVIGDAPAPRSDAVLEYDTKNSRLILLGGWANRWYDDMFTLDVGNVVGPPYAIMEIYPTMGAITGGTALEITGIDFPTSNDVVVRFATKKFYMDVRGTFVSQTQLKCLTPDFSKFHACTVDVRVALDGDSFTNTSQKFQFFSVTNAKRCIVYGPALLNGGAVKEETMFVILARDSDGHVRTTGGDEMKVKVTSVDVDEEGVAFQVHGVHVLDQGDGTYIVTFTVSDPGHYVIEVEFMGTFGGEAGHVRGSPCTVEFMDFVPHDNNTMSGKLVMDALRKDLDFIRDFVGKAQEGILTKLFDRHGSEEEQMAMLIKVKEQITKVLEESEIVELAMDRSQAILNYLQAQGINLGPLEALLRNSKNTWAKVLAEMPATQTRIAPMIKNQAVRIRADLQVYDNEVKTYTNKVLSGIWKEENAENTPTGVLEQLLTALAEHEQEELHLNEMTHLAKMFDISDEAKASIEKMETTKAELKDYIELWKLAKETKDLIEASKDILWVHIDTEGLEENARQLLNKVKRLPRTVKESKAYESLSRKCKDFLNACPLIHSLKQPAVRPRHWKALYAATGANENMPMPSDNPKMRLREILNLEIHKHSSVIEEITEKAVKEAKLEANLEQLNASWANINFEMTLFKETDVPLLRLSDEAVEILESDQLMLQGMVASRYTFFREDSTKWQQALHTVSEVVTVLTDLQRLWSYLEPLFIGSEEVKKELADETAKFIEIDGQVRAILKNMWHMRNVKQACTQRSLLPRLETLQEVMEMCKKNLTEFLDQKRQHFPRFYFVSEADLLDILSNSSNPTKVMKHIDKLLLATKSLTLLEGGVLEGDAPRVVQFVASVGDETVEFEPSVMLEGKVEQYLTRILQTQRLTLGNHLKRSTKRYPSQQRVAWLLNKYQGKPTDPAQISLLVNGVMMVREIEASMDGIARGEHAAMLSYQEMQLKKLNDLIRLTQTELTRSDRQRIMCMITMDAHTRDVLERLIRENALSKNDFQWKSQLKQRYLLDQSIIGQGSEEKKDDASFFSEADSVESGGIDLGPGTKIDICDASFGYGFEYLGNGPRLVITPLTDRIYVTATQALHLGMGCAPAGPAGTGKTETTKDLASAMGKCCYVFNCSPEMDYQSIGNIFKGLASSGAWGCFDEFNRLIPEVLSVCSVQFKAVCDGVRLCQASGAFNVQVTIEGEEVELDPSCGAFITMNPGYLGRSELPEGLKALFRPITVMVPDLVLICENMLMAEGFVESRSLASKFFGLYSLLQELLSKQEHYDWGLRAVKSVLVVAGTMKRAEPDLPEPALLLRALRDFNVAKIAGPDSRIFFGLLGDLFPGVDPPRKYDDRLGVSSRQACEDTNIWPDEYLLLKMQQLEELLQIRHCVFVMGSPGSGKSTVWKTLANAKNLMNPTNKVLRMDLNPKVFPTESLYGHISVATREWKDGLLSVLLRDLGNIPDEKPKWLILDGDLDANWIESMNSVMDDNRMLTLASNERIPLKPHMRMIFEIRDLRYATPATVSRAGILFLSNETSTLWQSLVASWVSTRPEHIFSDMAKEKLQTMFQDYVPPCLQFLRTECSKGPIFPVEQATCVQNLLRLLEGVLRGDKVGSSSMSHTAMEHAFVFSAVWAFGSMLQIADDGTDYRKEFNNWWRNEFKNVRMPTRDTVFDYWLDPETMKFEPWKNCPVFSEVRFDSLTMRMSEVTVPTTENCSVAYWTGMLIQKGFPAMLCGPAGTGKTQLVLGILKDVDPDQFSNVVINVNFYTTAQVLQDSLEQNLVKRSGTSFGPTGMARMIFFIDDLNLPEVDPYNTQSAIALIRQHMDYGHWYDNTKLSLKTIMDCQYLASMNPTAGSFTVNPRLQRHFVTFVMNMPSATSLLTIYQTFLDGHFQSTEFNTTVQGISSSLIKGALAVHKDCCDTFRKTAANFHYEFNIRHLANLFQGLLMAEAPNFEYAEKFVHLWLHESQRVYGDRLVSAGDLEKFAGIMDSRARKAFPQFNCSRFFLSGNFVSDPLIFCHFTENWEDEPEYDQVTSAEVLRVILENALADYNDTNPVMELVLFENAALHVTKITRIVRQNAGHAMLVGVGGSGKQSLSKLAAHLCGFSVFQISITQSYSMADLKGDIQSLYNKAGIKGEGVVFLLTDAQITNERFLVFINDLLSSGNIPSLYTKDEQDAICNQIFNKVKSKGLPTDPATCWKFFLAEVRANLHVVLCSSPMNPAFRVRARRFPALVSCVVYDWFQPWPRDALVSVAQKYIEKIELLSDVEIHSLVEFMPESFIAVNKMCKQFKESESRHVYTTPKSYLELLKVFVLLLKEKRDASTNAIYRLENGLEKLRSSAEAVGSLQETLQAMLEEAERKREIAETIAEKVSADKEIVEKETAKANAESIKVAEMQENCSEIAAEAEYELAKAEPAVVAAMAALDTLDKRDLGNCKTMARPPPGVEDIFAAVIVLVAGVSTNIPIQKSGKVKDKDRSWDAAKKYLLNNVNALIDLLKTFKTLIEEGVVSETNFKEVRPYLALPHFNVEDIEKKNGSAAGLCSWVINIVNYYDIVKLVEPKRAALFKARAELEEANNLLQAVQKRVAELQEQLDVLAAEFEVANKAKEEAQQLAENGRLRLELAQRLIAALGSENERWAAGVVKLKAGKDFIVGDVLLASAFLSYVGPFTKPFRRKLFNDDLLKFVKGTNGIIKISENLDPLNVLTNEAQIASWNTQGLPADPVSAENGTIVSVSVRWPLLIDPQLQGVAWIKKREGVPERRLQVCQLGQMDIVKKLEAAVENGWSFLLENMGEHIDAVLMPVITRACMKKGTKTYIKVGEDEVEFNPKFRFYLHTKLFNPHYPPEIQAETTLVNFTVTPAGLEDQLLSLVVRKERPDLASTKAALIQQKNQFTVRIKQLEDEILEKLSDAEGDITEDRDLIESLERAKKLAGEIQEKLKHGEITSQKINETAECYRSVAKRGSLLFFIMNDLYKIHTYYIYSLNAFVVMFIRGIELVQQKKEGAKRKSGAGGMSLMQRLQNAAAKVVLAQRFSWNIDILRESVQASDADMQKLTGLLMLKQASSQLQVALSAAEEEEEQRDDPLEMMKYCTNLKKSITTVLFNYLRRGLFERDKLTVATLMALRIQVEESRVNPKFVHALLANALAEDAPPLSDDLAEWLNETQWGRLKQLEDTLHTEVPQFAELCESISSDADDWYEWYNHPMPESVPCPGVVGDLEGLPKLLLLRAMRPDRVTYALQEHIKQSLGEEFIHQPPFDLSTTFQESSASTPIFFVLFPGVDPTGWVEELGQKFEMSTERGNFVNISMGQGQEGPAEAVLERMAEVGGWVMLQNVHLMESWLVKLDRKLEAMSDIAHQHFRCFISAEPPPLSYLKNIPEGLLQACVKVANEAPADLRSNLRRAWANFSQSRLDECPRLLEFRACLFGLCFFHSVMLGRRRFGPQGWSRFYGFNTGDLSICANVLQSHLESTQAKVPWQDLRYIFGEIMYGGHITDFWDRRVNNTYLVTIMNEGLMSSAPLAPSFYSPDPNGMDFGLYMAYIDKALPPEAPTLFGLHPNAEISYLSNWGDKIFSTILELQAGGSKASDSSEGGGGATRVRHAIEELAVAIPSSFDMVELNALAKEQLEQGFGPYVVVALQECTRMNTLLLEIENSINELKKGINGQLSMSQKMEDLAEAISLNQVPGRNPFHLCSWEKFAWPSRKGLQAWFHDVGERVKQLVAWCGSPDFKLPFTIWLPGLFNPTALLTAVKQVSARRRNLPLDKMTVETHVTAMLTVEQANEFASYPEHGVLVHGLFMEGARWLSGEEAESYQVSVDDVVCAGFVTDSILKELLPAMPIIYIKAVAVEKEWEPTSVGFFRAARDVYNCPVYITMARGPTYVFLATLRTLEPQSKWILAGVALILQSDI